MEVSVEKSRVLLATLASVLWLGACAFSTQAQSPDFTISVASGATSVDPGNPYPYAVWVSPVNGFSGAVTFTVKGLPAGATGTFKTANRSNPLAESMTTDINGGPAESTLTVSTSPSTPEGTSTLTITATSGSRVHSATATLTVNPAPMHFVVTDHGAKCDGSTNDAGAINSLISKISAAGGVVEFPAGKKCKSGSIHLMSNVRLQLDAGAELEAYPSIDDPESIGCTDHQDFGHSHFHDALIWGENLENVGLQGSGTITGDGVLKTGGITDGKQGDKVLSLKLSKNVTITGITITDGGHFGILVNGIDNMSVSNVKILEASSRDAFNLINSSNVVIDGSDIEGSDDSMVLKSDWALCEKGSSENVYVSNSLIKSTGNNATQFGSETCGNFTNIWWANLDLTESGKAGIGITTQDGAVIDGVTYDNISIAHAADPIYMKIDDLIRCGISQPPGTIKNISIANVIATDSESGSTGTFTNTINGMPPVNGNPRDPISNVTVTNTQYESLGGGSASDAGTMPADGSSEYTGSNVWTPKHLGTRPSYGWYLRHVDNITLKNDTVSFSKNDERPAYIADDCTNCAVDGFVFEVGSGSPYDLGFFSVDGYHVDAATKSNTGAAPRIHAVNSTPN